MREHHINNASINTCRCAVGCSLMTSFSVLLNALLQIRRKSNHSFIAKRLSNKGDGSLAFNICKLSTWVLSKTASFLFIVVRLNNFFSNFTTRPECFFSKWQKLRLSPFTLTKQIPAKALQLLYRNQERQLLSTLSLHRCNDDWSNKPTCQLTNKPILKRYRKKGKTRGEKRSKPLLKPYYWNEYWWFHLQSICTYRFLAHISGIWNDCLDGINHVTWKENCSRIATVLAQALTNNWTKTAVGIV